MTLSPEALAEQRLAELITLNELGLVVSSTLDRHELIERALQAVTRHLRFDRALILLVDPVRNVLTDGRSVGGSPEMAARIAELELAVDLEHALLSRLARSDGPLLFRDVDEDPDDGNREFARLLEVSSFLGTPLVTKGRTVGVLAVDNRLTGRDVMPGDGPLLYTVGSLLAGGLENARLYADLEEQKAVLEQRVLERTADLVEARQAAEAATEAKSRFLSNVSHELRTPLTSVAKIEAGRIEWRSEPVDIGEVITRATAATASLLRPDSGPKLLVEVEHDLPPVTADRDRLIQVVINLISNAVKFTPEGSITIVAWRDVEGGWIQVAVSDTGVGIAEADLDKVFEPFAQASPGGAAGAGGTGLGLPICREIIEHHGGRLWLENRLGAGSTFRFTLPI